MDIAYRVVVPAEVELAIVAHAQYIALQGGSPQNASRWIDAVEHAVSELATYPLRFPLAPDFGLVHEARMRVILDFVLIYSVNRQARVVTILSARHGHQLPTRRKPRSRRKPRPKHP